MSATDPYPTDWSAASTVAIERRYRGCHLRVWHWPLGFWGPEVWHWRVYIPAGNGSFVSGDEYRGDTPKRADACLAAEQRADLWATP